ncbi:MAG: ATP-binding protein [Chloroflexota bacterium]
MISKTFPGDFSSLGPISDFIANAAKQAGLDENSIYSVQLAVDEACTNIIEHAYGGEGNGEIVCRCDSNSESFRIELRDQGKQFNPDTIPVPEVGAPLESLGNRGAGLFLMKKLMDQVEFDFSKSNETILRMTKKK